MRLTNETTGRRWLILTAVWAVLTVIVFVHASIVRDYLSIVGSLGARPGVALTTPLKQAYPAFAADAQTWVRHALTLSEGKQVRLRHTDIDNAPYGREVHWNSAWGWAIALAGRVDHWVSGAPVPEATERITVWLTPLTLILLTIVVSSWVAGRAGALAGAVAAIAIVGHPRVYEGFFPCYVDHHGLLTMAVVAMAIGSLMMGAGWWKAAEAGAGRVLPASPEMARQAAVFSGLSGALGMWVSAASVIPPIGMIGAAGLLTVLVFGRTARDGGSNFDPTVWRIWGRVGAGASFGFYLLEYFPNHLGLRLEANHPLYSLAWLGGGEIIAQLGQRWLGGKGAPPSRRNLGLALAAVAVAPLTILLGGTRVFVVSDPFLSQLHKMYIQEFLPLWVTIRGMGWRTFSSVVGLENLPLLVGLGMVMVQRRRVAVVVGFATMAGVMFTAVAWTQSRWLLNASGFQVGLALILIGYFTHNSRLWLRWTVGLLAAVAVFMPYAFERITAGKSDVASRRVGPKDANAALFRDVAQIIRASQPEGNIVLLTSPNSSTAIGYYGRFQTMGTLYWENNSGLQAAAAVLSATSPGAAAELVRKYKITHIAMISEENFIEPYFRLLNPGAQAAEFKKSFGYQLLVERVIPTWLQMIPYNVPADLAALNVSALLFKVAFDQTPADALYHIALAKVAMGNVMEAEQDFDTLIKGSPNSPEPFLRKGELLFKRKEWQLAAEAMVAGIRRSPADARLSMFATTAGTFFRNRQYALAVQIYEVALADGFNPQIAAFLAFVLATASDDAVRNGPRAVSLAEQALKADPSSPTILNSLAVALAETGKFAEAVATADRALANARAQGQGDAIAVSETRLAAFRAGKRIRE
jgi:tetratricopeptide (TPR) repeat protein